MTGGADNGGDNWRPPQHLVLAALTDVTGVMTKLLVHLHVGKVELGVALAALGVSLLSLVLWKLIVADSEPSKSAELTIQF